MWNFAVEGAVVLISLRWVVHLVHSREDSCMCLFDGDSSLRSLCIGGEMHLGLNYIVFSFIELIHILLNGNGTL